MGELNVLFYTGSKNEVNEKLYSLADIVSLSARTRVFRNIDDLSRRLSQPVSDGATVAVLLAGNKEDLLKMVSIRHLLLDIPIILILYDREEDTTAMGYALYPRFLTYADSNPAEVAAVLGKMLENYNKNHN